MTSPPVLWLYFANELHEPRRRSWLEPAPSTITSLSRALHRKTVLFLGSGGLENLMRFGQHVGDQLGGDTMVLEVEEAQ